MRSYAHIFMHEGTEAELFWKHFELKLHYRLPCCRGGFQDTAYWNLDF